MQTATAAVRAAEAALSTAVEAVAHPRALPIEMALSIQLAVCAVRSTSSVPKTERRRAQLTRWAPLTVIEAHSAGLMRNAMKTVKEAHSAGLMVIEAYSAEMMRNAVKMVTEARSAGPTVI